MNFLQLEQLSLTLQKLAQKDLPFSLAYKLTKLQAALGEEEKLFSEQLRVLIEDNAERDEKGQILQNGENIQIKKDRIDEVNQKLQEIYNVEIVTPSIKLYPEDFKNISLSPNDLQSLMLFIEEENE